MTVPEFMALASGLPANNPHLGLKFLLTWFSVAALIIAWGLLNGSTAQPLGTQTAPSASARLTRMNKLPWVLFGAFVLVYVALIFAGTNYTDHDNNQLTLFSVRGIKFSPPIWGDGRFFPLSHQEFNVIRFIARSCAAYHVLGVVELLVMLVLANALLDELPIRRRLFTLALVLIVPSIAISFFGLIYPERNQVLAILVMLFGIRRFDESGKRLALVFALLAAHASLYYKEPTFVIVFTFAAGRLVLRWMSSRGTPGHSLRRVLSSSRAELALLVVTAVFLLLFAWMMLPKASLGYAEANRSHTRGGTFSVLFDYLKSDLLVTVFIAVVATRALRVLRTPMAADLLWDPLALGAVGYTAAYAVLKLYAPYYLAPVDVIAVLYLARIMSSQQRPRFWTSAICVLITGQNALGFAYHLIERKNIMQAKHRAAEFVKALAQKRGNADTRLYFPNAEGYQIMEFAAYLSYLGVDIGEDQRASHSNGRVVLESPRLFTTGKCVSFREQIHCNHTPDPASDAFWTYLPDDPQPLQEVRGAAQRVRTLYQYVPFAAPRVLRPVLSLFKGVSIVFWDRPLPQNWLTSRIEVVQASTP